MVFRCYTQTYLSLNTEPPFQLLAKRDAKGVNKCKELRVRMLGRCANLRKGDPTRCSRHSHILLHYSREDSRHDNGIQGEHTKSAWFNTSIRLKL
jgi:hypothetical protein